MTTLNQIHDILKTIAENHAIIKGFGFGADYDMAVSTDTEYPLMYVEVQPSTYDDKNIIIPFNIVFADRVDKGQNNETDVLSDMLNVGLDVRAWLHSPDSYSFFAVEKTGSLTPFRDATDDEVAGWVFEISLRLTDLKDRCNLPIE